MSKMSSSWIIHQEHTKYVPFKKKRKKVGFERVDFEIVP